VFGLELRELTREPGLLLDDLWLAGERFSDQEDESEDHHEDR
jgi:hypothetical protein